MSFVVIFRPFWPIWACLEPALGPRWPSFGHVPGRFGDPSGLSERPRGLKAPRITLNHRPITPTGRFDPHQSPPKNAILRHFSPWFPPYPNCISIYTGQQDISNCWDCEQDSVVELWDKCYSKEYTTRLYLSNSGLSGSIPTEIGDLTNLERLYLHENQLTGEIPSEIGDLINLNYLNTFLLLLLVLANYSNLYLTHFKKRR